MANNPTAIRRDGVESVWGALTPISNVPSVVGTDPRVDLNDQALVLANRNAFPVVAQQKRRRDNLGVAAGAAIALVLGCATFVSLSSSRAPKTAPATPQTAIQPAAPSAMQVPGMPAPVGGLQAMPAPMPEPMPAVGPMGSPEQMTVSIPHTPSPVLVFDGGAPPVATGPSAGGAADDSGTPAMLGGGSSTVAGGEPVDTAAATSTRMADPTNTVVQGTLIPAVLETAINSDLPGYARAVVSQDVRSFDGRRILIPRSSRLIGEYKTGLAAGQKRAYLLWTRLVRPDGISVALASPAVDFSGQAGVTGKVNDHFFQRFGSAILLSIFGGASALVGGGASTVVVSGGQSAASVAAQHDSQRPPTIRVRPGEPVRVFTARDLIFAPGSGGKG
jgi:type IV secretion system protein VirB10